MSLQVIFSVYAPNLGEIHAFTAGDDQTLICQNTTIIEATIVGNPANHIFEWEQIEGDPVVWLSPVNQQFRYLPGSSHWTKIDDQLYKTHASIQRTTASDLSLRFWIDRRAKNERYDDVIIFGTPTSTALTYNNSNATSMYYNIGDVGRRTPASTFDVIPDFGQEGIAQIDTDFDLMLRWAPPSVDAALVENVIVETVNTITYQWDVVATLPKDATTYGPIIDGRTYRIRHVFVEDTNKIEEYRTQISSGSRPALFRADTRIAISLSTATSAASAVIGGMNGAMSAYNVLVRTLLLQNYQSDGDAITNAVIAPTRGQINSYSVLERTLLVLPVEQSDSFTTAGTVIAPTRGAVTAYNVLNIGGIVIGG
jgi:hypothetical protein